MSKRTAKIWRRRRQELKPFRELVEWKATMFGWDKPKVDPCLLEAERIMAELINQSGTNIGRFLYEPMKH